MTSAVRIQRIVARDRVEPHENWRLCTTRGTAAIRMVVKSKVRPLQNARKSLVELPSRGRVSRQFFRRAWISIGGSKTA